MADQTAYRHIIPNREIFLIVGCTFVGLMAGSGFGQHLKTLAVQEKMSAKFHYVISTWPGLFAFAVPKVTVAGLLCWIFDQGKWTC